MPPRPKPDQFTQQAPEDARKYIVYDKFETMDTQRTRIGMQPQRLGWCENLQIIAPNNLRAVPAPLAPLAMINGATISKLFEAHFLDQNYLVAFTTDGAGYTVNTTSGTVVQFAPSGSFSAPDMTVYNSARILIADPTAGYCTWDGTAFVEQGGVSPNIIITAAGAGYATPPTVAITGGSGTGATAEAFLINGQVTKITLTNPGTGYLAGDTLTVTLTGGGFSTPATATAIVWPFLGFSPNSVAIFQGRVWITGFGTNATIENARILQWSGAVQNGLDNFDPAKAAGSTEIVDSDMKQGITAIRSLAGFLYIFGDSSVRLIGSISVSGSPSQTLFTITPITSDQGTIWPQSITSFNKLPIFANPYGVFAIFGSTVNKISDPMDGIFQSIDVVSLLPQSAVVDLFGQHTLLVLLKYNDPVIGSSRSLMIALTGQIWYVISQGDGVSAIAGISIASKNLLFVSSGSDVTQALADPNSAVPIRVETALSDDSQSMQQKRAVRAAISQSGLGSQAVLTWAQESENGQVTTNFSILKTIIWVNSLGQVVTWTNSSGQVVQWAATGYRFQPLQVQATGIYLGGTLTGNATQLTINSFVIEYVESAPMRSLNVG